MTEQMGTPGSTADNSVNGSKVGASKDKACPFCHQQFTSSSLGRHLDLYIKEKNPKPADGIHDVDEIRKLRGGITRRQPRNSTSRREDSTPVGTPGAQDRRSPAPPESERGGNRSPSLRRESIAPDFPNYRGKPEVLLNKPSWQSTGVMNHIPAATRNGNNWDGDDHRDTGRRVENRNRSVSKHMLAKTTFEQKEKMIEALDNAKAAELALREMLGSIRAAKQRIEGPTIFDYDPLTLDFPSLALKCLPPPPTLHQSTPIPTSTSWSILPPGDQQYQALRTHFSSEFHRWRVSCQLATTTPQDDLSYPPQPFIHHNDPAEIIQRAEAEANELENKISEHLHSVFAHWNSFSASKRNELWTLQLARNVGSKSEEIEKLKKEKDLVQQEATHLKLQVDELSRLRHPREFTLSPPGTLPIDGRLIHELGEDALNHRGVGWNLMDRELHIDTVVERAIERWKDVVKDARGGGPLSAGGMAGQRSLSGESASTQPVLPPKPPAQNQNQIQNQNINHNNTNHNTTNTENVQMTNGTDMGSDQDADADMEEDDSYVENLEMANTGQQRAPDAPMATNFRLTNGNSTTQQRQGGGGVMEGLENQVSVGGYVRIGA